jgi:hypothetical protein
MSKPNLQQIPIPGRPGREVVERFLGLSDEYRYSDKPLDDETIEGDMMDDSDWDELDPYPGDDDDDPDEDCLPGVPL